MSDKEYSKYADGQEAYRQAEADRQAAWQQIEKEMDDLDAKISQVITEIKSGQTSKDS